MVSTLVLAMRNAWAGPSVRRQGRLVDARPASGLRHKGAGRRRLAADLHRISRAGASAIAPGADLDLFGLSKSSLGVLWQSLRARWSQNPEYRSIPLSRHSDSPIYAGTPRL